MYMLEDVKRVGFYLDYKTIKELENISKMLSVSKSAGLRIIIKYYYDNEFKRRKDRKYDSTI